MNVLPRMPQINGSQTVSHTASHGANAVEISLNAAVISIDRDTPCLLLVRDSASELLSLPAGPFVPNEHISLELGVRNWVAQQSGVDLGYVEQLYTFGGTSDDSSADGLDTPTVSLGYLALTSPDQSQGNAGHKWVGAYDFLPWEDWRDGRPEILSEEIEPRLQDWSAKQLGNMGEATLAGHSEALRIAFGLDGATWDEERVLDRYELLHAIGLLDQPGFGATTQIDSKYPAASIKAVSHAHRRILAAALGRLRAKIKYRPVLFELMAPEFTLFELQRTVEAILGSRLHKQNFRRLVESGGLVDATADIRTHTGGRPAKLFRFRREVLMERPAPGVRVRAGLAA
jgi:hypothetical protein